MLKNGNQAQMWMQPEVRDTFRQIAQLTGEKAHEVAARLAEQERIRLAQAAGIAALRKV